MKTSISPKSLRYRWIGWRNRLLTSPHFQRFAVRNPLTRPIARARARTLFDLVAGFTYSQVLAACVSTRLLDVLADSPLDVSTIASRVDLPPQSAERLLRAAASLKLVERLGSGWALGSAGAALLGNRGVIEMIAHHHLLYADLADPVALLRRGGGGGSLSRHWPYAESSGATNDVAAYSNLMGASQPLVAAQVLDAYRFARHRRLLDVGGSDGAFLIAAGKRAPRLEMALFDLPSVVERARARIAAAGLMPQTTIFAGSFLADSLPTGYDLVTLVRVLHDHDDAQAMVLLRAIRTALPAGGRLLIAEPMAETPGAEPMGDAYFGFYLLAMGSGKPRPPREIISMLSAAGFASARLIPTAMPLTARAIIANT